MIVDEGSEEKSDIKPHWMAVHAHLKNEITVDEKCHNLMTWLISGYPSHAPSTNGSRCTTEVTEHNKQSRHPQTSGKTSIQGIGTF